MVGLANERVLLIGDGDRTVHAALTQVLPLGQVTSVPTWFDGIAELSNGKYTSVLAAAEPIERRPESAVRVLRDLLVDGRILLFGNTGLEPLSRKMLDYGCDDYIVTPPSPHEIQQLFGQPPLRIAPSGDPSAQEPAGPSQVEVLATLPLAEILLDALLHHPSDAAGAAVAEINALIAAPTRLYYIANGKTLPEPPEGTLSVTHVLRSESAVLGTLVLIIPKEEEETGARHALTQVSQLFSKLGLLQERHKGLLKLAIVDELTGVYNGRYFKQFLKSICEKSRVMRFPVTLLLFDIDDFKRYNDQFGHGVGDDILRQTSQLMRRCCRDHDLVARISGDEFAVVFWQKEDPRQPREPKPTATSSRLPQTPKEVYDRFRRLLASPDFQVLGNTGKGTLTISAGLAVFPYEASTPEALIDLADKRLMFGAKKSGKDALFLVGGQENGPPLPIPPQDLGPH